MRPPAPDPATHAEETKDDRGMTLVELTVTMAITAILAIAVSALFTGLSKTVNFTSATMDTTAEARVAVQSMTQTMRAAVPSGTDVVAVTVAKADSVTFYASLDRSGGTSTTTVAPTLVSFAWNGSTCINRTLDGASSTCVMRTTTAPVFSYFDSATSTTGLTVPVAGLDLATRHTVDAIGITLTSTKPLNGGRTATSQVQDRVTLANCVTAAC